MKIILSMLMFCFVSMLTLSAGAAGYQVANVTDGGTVTGKVTFSGNDPAPTNYGITKDNEVCGTGNRQIDYVKVVNGVPMDTIVYLDKVKSGKAFASKGEGELDQKGCEFRPFFQVMHNDQNLKVINSDAVGHNIHTYELIGRARRTVLNVSQAEKGSVINNKIMLRVGTAMKIECDKHDFMHGFIFVAQNPYYAVVSKDGTFTINGIPAGTYTIKAWHGTLGEQKASVNVEPGKTAKVDFAFTP